MRNLKKLLAVVVAICVIATFTVPAFAADAAAAAPSDAKICSDLGVLQGDGNGVTDTYLAKGTTRLQAAILYLRLLGKEDEALAETSTDNFADAKDLTWAAGKNVLAYLKKNPSLGWQGDGVNFTPNAPATAQMIYKVMLVALGYVEGTDFQYADALAFAGEKGLTKVAYTTEITNNDMAIALVETLKTKVKAGDKTLAADLVAKNIITAAAADATGLVPAYTPAALNITGAVALNSKVVEVTLGTAATAADLIGVTVKDSAAKDVAVSKVEMSPWSTDGKSVLVTLGADTVVGTYYTLTAGTKSVNFGGRSADTSAPTVTKVESTDYNQITVTFSEPILLGGTVTSALNYPPSTVLATSGIAYASNSSITLTTDAQASSLYSTKISGFKDLAGNTMTEDTAKTFVGQVKNTTANTVTGVNVVDSKTIEVAYALPVDSTTSLDKSKYSVKLMYAPNTEIPVASAALKSGTANTVVLTFGTDTVASLYQLTIAAGVKTKYDVATTAAITPTFVGAVKDTTAIGSITAAPSSNTKVVLTMGTAAAGNSVDAATAKEMFSIKTQYAPITELAISSISISGNTVTLTTAAQAGVLYVVTAKTGLKDVAGNATTADLTSTFVGAPVAAKISSITSATLDASGTELTVVFGGSVGASATDVSHYSIDGGVGYPSKAVVSSANTVKLTVPATTNNSLYKLTVKNLENADGIAMDAAGITATFVGKGVTATLPTIQAVVASDNQTLKIYFDRDVSGSTVAGATKIWNANAINAGALIYSKTTATAATAALPLTGNYAYQDATNKNILVVRVPSTTQLFNAAGLTGVTTYKLGYGAGLVANTAEMLVAPSEATVTNPTISGIIANDSKTLTVYFSEDVANVAAGDFAISTASDSQAGTVPTVSTVYQVDGKTYKLGLTVNALEAKAYFLRIVGATDAGNTTVETITDKTGIVEMASTVNSTTAADYYAAQFAGNATTPAAITSIAVNMTDAKTIVVYYPEAMNTTDATTKANYGIVDSTDAAVTMSGGASFVPATHIANIAYDPAVNTATITLNKTITTAGNVYVKFATAIKNATGVATVNNAGAQITKQFAMSTAAPAKVIISSASLSGGTLTITLSQNATAATALSAANFLTYFTLTNNNGTAVTAVTTVTNVAGTNTITVSGAFTPAMVAGQIGTVALTAAGATNFTGINGEAGDSGAAAVTFVQ